MILLTEKKEVKGLGTMVGDWLKQHSWYKNLSYERKIEALAAIVEYELNKEGKTIFPGEENE